MTYFFHSVVEGKGNAIIALEMTKNKRSHRNANTTSIYIKTSNQDGPLDKVSLNLFKRGNFGWLYNLLLDSIYDDYKEKKMEEKTSLIEKYSDYFHPVVVENMTSFLIHQQQKKQSLALELAMMDKEVIKAKLQKINNGQFPSRTENAQCFKYEDGCSTPTALCATCHFIIPQNYILVSIQQQIDELIREFHLLEEYQVNERIKLTNILFKVMDLIKQAVEEFGKEYVSTFIDLKIKDKLNEIKHKFLT